MSGWPDAARVAELLSVDPDGLGGVRLRGRPGPPRRRVLEWVRERLPPEAPFRRLPAHVSEDRLLGGLALAETLRSGRAVMEQGVLARSDGGLLVVAMAERAEREVVAHLCAALDRGAITVERDGMSAEASCRVGLIALDEGIDEEHVDPALADRLAFALDLDVLDLRGGAAPDHGPEEVARARARLPQVSLGDDIIAALSEAAQALGVEALRPLLLAAKAARAHAALLGRTRVEEEDAGMAARLVLGPRATRAPSAEPEEAAEREAEEGEADPGGSGAAAAGDRADGADETPPGEIPLGDLVLAAAESGIPAGLLDALDVGTTRRAGATGRSGAARIGPSGGRPAGTRAAPPTRGQRLNVVETLRAAAPWQRLRGGGFGAGVRVRPEDFRVTRHRQPTESCVIFAVDASGSAALRRLAEAKGAVERVLGDCYVRRDHVALVAFRQGGAELLLPPTRSLARVRRSLAALAGGGATPLAAGIDAAHRLALDARGRGREPIVVVMTDGRANVTRDGRQDPTVATTDALESARGLQRAAVPTLFLDTAPRPRRRARELAEAMDARYLPLPYLDAAGISRHVQALAREGAR